ncbi:hypothetical protein CCR75_006768 [Bremia lactucae]|uniref:Little elongation complex subunit 2 C-terminal domain-containing protein n=1 Tax=Bremia lactucae TaxID=4779 RepID=A0A976FNF9_BRELC|nr:hypothetical protein CCR75_006768 [Bremia lactucae]
MDSATTFAVPRQLFAGRKRRPFCPLENRGDAFFTIEDYEAHSIRGDVHESRLYESLETSRQTILTPLNASTRTHKRTTPMKIKHQSKNLVQLLVEAIENHRMQAPETMLELDNGRRRISGLSVAQHEQYLKLQRKCVQAQQRGLPEVLALSEEETTEWHELTAMVEQEQVSYCRMIMRGLATEAAVNDTKVPEAAESWCTTMLDQCWNDIYRLYPRYFEPCLAIELATSRSLDGPSFAAIKAHEVASRGTCCTINSTAIGPGQPLWSPVDNSDDIARNVVSPRQAISTDVQAKELMETHDCDLAISSSTLVTLFDSDSSTRFAHVPTGWGIPMTCRTGMNQSGNTPKKRVFLDQPLLGESFGTRDKIIQAGRVALLSRWETESVTEGSTGGQTSYYVWQLHERRILVRSTTHARLFDRSLSKGELDRGTTNRSSTPLSVFIKPDYHLLGIEEQLTLSERCRFWLHSWLRGGSSILVARVHPDANAITSFKTYSPASLIYGEHTDQVLPLELFNPSCKFQWLSTLFSTLGELPVGNYLLRPRDGYGSSTFGKKRGGIDVLMATTEPMKHNVPVVDLYSFMPKSVTAGTTMDLKACPTSILPSWNLPDRIPYTFQTGTYCLSFFLNGECSTLSSGKSCDLVHLRLKEHPASSSKRLVRMKRWNFENYTEVLKTATRSNSKVLIRPKRVTLPLTFCGEKNRPPTAPSLADVYAPVHCNKRPDACSLPHFTLHQILERLADDMLRKGRGKRRTQKYGNRQQGKLTARLDNT